jgi:hypothetical protein
VLILDHAGDSDLAARYARASFSLVDVRDEFVWSLSLEGRPLLTVLIYALVGHLIERVENAVNLRAPSSTYQELECSFS